MEKWGGGEVGVNHATWGRELQDEWGRSHHFKQSLLKIRLKENWKKHSRNHSDKVSLIKIQCHYKRQDILFIDMSALESKSEREGDTCKDHSRN